MSNLAQFQTWLNQRGASPALKVDGKAGPATRAAVFQVFRCTDAQAVSDAALQGFAARLGCSVRQIKAVARTESAGSGWDSTGLMTVLYERHYLWRRIQVRVPFLADPTPGGYTVDADKDGINDSWEKLADSAMGWSPQVAFECASYGKFQIMGAWWKRLGYPSVLDFVYEMTRSETAHFEALVRYVKEFGLTAAMRAISANAEDCRAFASGYNGKGYEKNNYHVKIAKNFVASA